MNGSGAARKTRGAHREWSPGRGARSRASHCAGAVLPIRAREKSLGQIRRRAADGRVARTRTAMGPRSSTIVLGGGNLFRP
jgi:hypothetical protein